MELKNLLLLIGGILLVFVIERVTRKLRVGGQLPPDDDEKSVDTGGELPPDDDEK